MELLHFWCLNLGGRQELSALAAVHADWQLNPQSSP